MPLLDIVILCVITGVFATFAAMLAFMTWYTSDKRKRAVEHGGRRHYVFPHDGVPIIDD